MPDKTISLETKQAYQDFYKEFPDAPPVGGIVAQPESNVFWGDTINEIARNMLITTARTARHALTLGNQDPTITTTLERWAIEEPEKRSQEYQQKYGQEGMWTSNWAKSASSIGYGIATAAPALGVGAVATVLGHPTLAHWTGGTVAGYVAYATTKSQKLDELFREANEASKQQRDGRALNRQEWNKIVKQNDYLNKTRAYGLYEAIPEAITLAMGWRVLRAGVGALPVIGKPLAAGATRVVGKVAAKALGKAAPLPLRMAGRVAALQAPEHIQEAYTGYQQKRIDQTLYPEATKDEPRYSAVGPFKAIPTKLNLLAETAIEQAPTVAITTGVLGGLGAGVSAGVSVVTGGTKSKNAVDVFATEEIQKLPHGDPIRAQRTYELTLDELRNNTSTIEGVENKAIASYEAAGYPEYADSARRAIEDYKTGVGLAPIMEEQAAAEQERVVGEEAAIQEEVLREQEREIPLEDAPPVTREDLDVFGDDMVTALATEEMSPQDMFFGIVQDYNNGVLTWEHLKEAQDVFTDVGQTDMAVELGVFAEQKLQEGLGMEVDNETITAEVTREVEERQQEVIPDVQPIPFEEAVPIEEITTRTKKEQRKIAKEQKLKEQLTEEERKPPEPPEEGIVPVEPTEPPVAPTEPTEVAPPVEKVTPEPTPVEKPVKPVKPAEPVAKEKIITEVETTPTGEETTISTELPEGEEKKLTPKEQKGYLLNEIDKAIGLTKREKIEPTGTEITDTVVFEVPNDGEFRIDNNKESLEEFKKRVARTFPSARITPKLPWIKRLRKRIAKEKREATKLSKPIVDKESGISFLRNIPNAQKVDMPIESVESTVTSMAKKIKIAKEEINLQVVSNISNTPEDVINAAKRGGATEDVMAVFDPATKTIYVLAENVNNNAEVERAVVHEVVGHLGLRKVLGNNYESIMQQVYDVLSKSNPELVEERRETYGLDTTKAEDRLTLAEELTAHLSENQNINPSLWRRIVTTIKRFLQKIGLTEKRYLDDLQINREEDIQTLIERARDFVIGESTGLARERKVGDIAETLEEEQAITFSKRHDRAQTVSPEEADRFINAIRNASIIEKQKADSEQNQDIIAEQEKIETEQRKYEGTIGSVLKWADAVRDQKKRGELNKPKDLGWVEKVLSLPPFFFAKFPATLRGIKAVINEASERSEIFHGIIGKIFGKKGDLITPINELGKKNITQYNKVNKLIIDNDLNQVETGFVFKVFDRDGNEKATVHSIEEADKLIRENAYHREKDKTGYDIFDLDGKKINHVETLEEVQAIEPPYYKKTGEGGYKILDENKKEIAHTETLEQAEAVKAYYDWTYTDVVNLNELQELGLTRTAAEAFSNTRKVINNTFDVMQKKIGGMIEERTLGQESMEKTFKLKGGEEITINLYEAHNTIKKARASFYPRIRKQGNKELWATKREYAKDTFNNKKDADAYIAKMEKVGYLIDKKDYDDEAKQYKVSMLKNLLNPWNEFFTNKTSRTVRARELEAKGYTEVKERDIEKQPPNILGMHDSILDIENQMRATMDRMNVLMEIETHDVKTRNQLSDLQAQFEDLLMLSLMEMIKGGGYRSHTIARRKEKGINVIKGYEEDLLKSLSTYTHSIAFGIAKSNEAEKMIRAMQGTDVVHRAEFVKKDKDGKPILDEKDKPVIDVKAYMAELDKHRINPKTQPKLYKTWMEYMHDQLRPNDKLDSAVGYFKMVVFMKFLAANISSPLVNATAFVTSNVGVMNGELGVGFTEAIKLELDGTNKYWRQYKLGKTEKRLSQGLLELFKAMDEKEWADAQLTNREAFAVLESELDDYMKKMLRVTMIPFAASEKMTRVGVITGSYLYLEKQARLGELTPDKLKEIGFTDEQIKKMGDMKDLNHVGPVDKDGNPTTQKGKDAKFAREAFAERSHDISNKSLGIFGKPSRAYVAWGESWGAKLAQLGLTFTTYPHTYLNTTYEYFRAGKEKRKAMLYMLAAPMVLAGVPAFPLAMQGVPVLSQLTHSILKKILDSDEPERDFYRWLNDISPNLESFARKGAIGSIGIDISGSLEFQMPSIKNNVVTALYQDLLESKEYWDQGDIGRIAETLIPSRLITSMLRTRREATEGITSRIGKPIFFGREQMRLTPTEIALQSLGLRPSRISEEKEIMWLDTKVEREYLNKRNTIYTRYRKYILKPIKKRKSAELDEIKRMIIDYNRRLRQKRAVDLTFPATIRPIEPEDLRRNLLMSLRPTRRERLRRKRE